MTVVFVLEKFLITERKIIPRKNKFYGGKKKRKVKDFSLKNCFSECAKLGCSVMSRRVC